MPVCNIELICKADLSKYLNSITIVLSYFCHLLRSALQITLYCDTLWSKKSSYMIGSSGNQQSHAKRFWSTHKAMYRGSRLPKNSVRYQGAKILANKNMIFKIMDI